MDTKKLQKKDGNRLLNAQKLRNSILKDKKLPKDILTGEGYQIHHLIPSQVVSSFTETYDVTDEEKKYLETIFDSAWNGVALLSGDDAIYHLGSHHLYNTLIEATLSSIEYKTIEEFIEKAQGLAQWILTVIQEWERTLRKRGQELNIDEFTEDILIPAILKDIPKDSLKY